jgi:FAD/FMN-containing dehydrogenase
MENHNATVRQIASKVRRFYDTNTPFRIYHGSTLSTRDSARERNKIIDVSTLNHVLKFDKEKKRVLVEPNVPMDALVAATIAEGLLPQIVMVRASIIMRALEDSADFDWGREV